MRRSIWRRAWYEVGWWVLPNFCRWHGRILWRTRNPIAQRMLASLPRDWYEYVEGDYDWPEGTHITVTTDSTWNYDYSAAARTPSVKEGESPESESAR